MSTLNKVAHGLRHVLSTVGGRTRTIPSTFVSRSYAQSDSSSSGGSMLPDGSSIVSIAEAKRFMVDTMVAVGACPENACAMADLLVAADHKGHLSHGLNRLDMYVKDVKGGTCDPNAKPCVVQETPATAWVDGKNGLGVIVGNYCMQLAIKKAKEVGVGWVVAKGSNHYGIAAWYSLQAVREGLLGMSFSNTSPLMCPTGAKEASLGTNPLTLAAAGKNGDSFILDMATTAVAVGKIEVQVKKKLPIPEGWALGPDGKPTTDAELGFQTGCLLPLGGSRLTSGYKGYGLGMLVEIFSGILGGANYGHHIRKWKAATERKEANIGHGFVAIDPKCFAPGFEDRLSELMDHLRCMEPVDPKHPVLVAGDPEKANMKKVDEQGGVIYHENQIKLSAKMAKELGIAPMKTL